MSTLLAIVRDDSVSQIKEIPGLYISGRGPATYLPKMDDLKITHIISVLKEDEIVPKREPPQNWASYQIKQVAIDDDGNEDILIHLNEVYQWIDDALRPTRTNDPNASNDPGSTNRVLVHCRAGMSRSGAFIVGYLMKKLSISYSAALARARMSRPVINPNSGFEQQLRIYEHCKYDIYLPVGEHMSSLKPTFQAEANVPDTLLEPNRNFKAAYKVWKKERDGRLGRGDGDRMRFGAMATMAAGFGRNRLGARNKMKEEPININSDDFQVTVKGRPRAKSDPAADIEADVGLQRCKSIAKQVSSEEQWRKVEEMEKKWNDKLIRGHLGDNVDSEDPKRSMDGGADKGKTRSKSFQIFAL